MEHSSQSRSADRIERRLAGISELLTRLTGVRHKLALAVEVCWPGCVALILATLLAGAAAVHVHKREDARLQERRWMDVLSELRRRVEAELALGFKLADSGRAQDLLEGALVISKDLRELTVFDPRGQVLFDTDRSGIGEQARDAWRSAASHAAWRIRSADDVSIGLPLRGPQQDVAGQITLSFSVSGRGVPWLPLVSASLLVTGAVFGLALLPAARLKRALEPSHGPGEHRLDDAERRLAEVDAALSADPQEDPS